MSDDDLTVVYLAGYYDAKKRYENKIEWLRKALDKAADALHDAGLYDAWAAARSALEEKE